jgi:hypothetical protein
MIMSVNSNVPEQPSIYVENASPSSSIVTLVVHVHSLLFAEKITPHIETLALPLAKKLKSLRMEFAIRTQRIP